jgi:hypothetical protein
MWFYCFRRNFCALIISSKGLHIWVPCVRSLGKSYVNQLRWSFSKNTPVIFRLPHSAVLEIKGLRNSYNFVFRLILSAHLQMIIDTGNFMLNFCSTYGRRVNGLTCFFCRFGWVESRLRLLIVALEQVQNYFDISCCLCTLVCLHVIIFSYSR